nr:3156_t:CDS:2 [Entrophospora candida]
MGVTHWDRDIKRINKEIQKLYTYYHNEADSLRVKISELNVELELTSKNSEIQSPKVNNPRSLNSLEIGLSSEPVKIGGETDGKNVSASNRPKGFLYVENNVDMWWTQVREIFWVTLEIMELKAIPIVTKMRGNLNGPTLA